MFDAADQVRLDRFGAALRDGDLGTLADLFLNDNEWITQRMPGQTGAVEGFWGVVGPNGVPLPGLDVVRRIGAETAGR